MSNQLTEKRPRGRPRKDTASQHETRQRLIRSGLEMLTEQGYSATGLDAILKRVNVPKGSFYHYFPSKEAFTQELITAYHRFFQHKLDYHFSQKTLTPIERLLSFVDDAIAGMSRYHFRRGCLVGNLGQEMAVLPSPFRQQLLDVFNDWQQRLAACLEEAKTHGEISAAVDAEEAAYRFWTGWEGAVLRARLEQSERPLRSFSQFFVDSIRH